MAGTGPAMTTHPVMPGLEPGIHALAPRRRRKTWMAGTGPAMTERGRAAALYPSATLHRHARPRAGHPRLGSSTTKTDVDGRDRPGHDGWGGVARDASATLRRHARP